MSEMKVSNSLVEWAWSNNYMKPLYELIAELHGNVHWSRQFEYPWILLNGNFGPDMSVLDAGGGDGPLQFIISKYSYCNVINLDQDHTRNIKQGNSRLSKIEGDISKTGFPDATFDRVICVSVIEHCENPVQILEELFRVLKPGGRLLVTMDIASYARYNHTIDKWIAQCILHNLFELNIPKDPFAMLNYRLAEENRKLNDPEEVTLKCLCFYVDKL